MRGAVLLLLLGLGCLPSPGPFRLEAVEGRVRDATTGVPIAGAEVIEWHRGAGVPGASQPVYHARWTTSAADGGFSFPAGLAPSPRMWSLKTYPPTYSFWHPDYGLQHGGPPQQGRVVLVGHAAIAAQARADVAPYCRGERTDAGSKRIAEVACSRRDTR